MPLAAVVAWFVLVMVVVSLLAYRYWVKPSAYMDRVGDLNLGLGLDAEEGQAGHRAFTRVLRQVGQAVPASPGKMRAKQRRLVAAGHRSETAVAVMYGIQVAAAAATGLLAAMALTASRKFGVEGVTALSLVFTAAGFAIPNEVLRLMIQRRRRTLRHALPDALDLLVICVEAGLGLDQALQDISKELEMTHPELSDEVRLVTLELRAGSRRAEALRNLADRTGELEVKKLVAILIQTDRFGTSIAQALRTHSDFLRVQRRQVAEERANKVGVKLVFPIFFFILPSMFLVTVGPALLALMFEFFPSLQQVR